jgi:oleate hydratase
MTMRNYARISAPPPEGIERKRAHIVGGGIAGLAAAVFLVDDAHMPADRITLYEALDVALDGAGDHQAGYTARGDREQHHESMECSANFSLPAASRAGRVTTSPPT